jgi:hypothetical protein
MKFIDGIITKKIYNELLQQAAIKRKLKLLAMRTNIYNIHTSPGVFWNSDSENSGILAIPYSEFRKMGRNGRNMH